MNSQPSSELDSVHHIAVETADVAAAIGWYTRTFRCEVVYRDETWAMLKFGNLSIALVTPGQHPPHIGFVSAAAASYGTLKTHRDGTRSLYLRDPSGNAVELLDPASLGAATGA